MLHDLLFQPCLRRNIPVSKQNPNPSHRYLARLDNISFSVGADRHVFVGFSNLEGALGVALIQRAFMTELITHHTS